MNFYFEFEIFSENIPPARSIEYKILKFDPSNKSILPNKLPSTTISKIKWGLLSCAKDRMSKKKWGAVDRKQNQPRVNF